VSYNATRGVVSDPRPRVAVRFDDSNLLHYYDAQIARKHRIPLSMVTLAGRLADGGVAGPDASPNAAMKKSQLRALAAEFARDGLGFEVASHTRDNWATVPDDMTMAEIDEQLRRDDLEDLVGDAVKVFVQPGDATQSNWAYKHRELVKERLDRLGYHYAIGLCETMTASRGGSLATIAATVDGTLYNPLGAGNEAIKQNNGYRPGQILDPYDFADTFTTDLGNTVVSRGVKAGGGGEPDPDPLSGSRGWILGEDNNGAGAEGSFSADWDKTWQYRYSRYLGSGLGFIVALHGEARTNAQAIGLSTGTAVVPRHMDYNHMFATLRAMEDAGFIVLCTLSEWCAYYYAEMAPGFELLNRGDFAIPHVEIGDLSAGHYVEPHHMTVGTAGQPSFNDGVFGALVDGDGDQLFDDEAGATLAEIIGPNVVGERGEAGGVLLRAGAGNDVNVGVTLDFCGLPPGYYRLRIPIWCESGNITIGENVQVAARYIVPAIDNFNEATGLARARELQAHVVFGSSDYKQLLLAPDEQWLSLDIPIFCGAELEPTASNKAAHTAGSIAGGGTETFTMTVTGARPGAPCRVFTEETLQAGLVATAEITDLNEATVTITNYTAGALTPPAGDYLVVCPLGTDQVQDRPANYGPAGPWLHSYRIDIGKDGVSLGKIGKCSLRYLAPV
jgi:hypothetical protein